VPLAHQGRAEDAIASFRRAVELDAGSWVAQYNLAVVLMQERRPADAVAPARAASQIEQSQRALALRLLGRALAQVGRYCDAAAAFREALAVGPGDEKLEEFLAKAEGKCGAPRGPGP
jgi:predicted Zn-dependent protease